MSRRTCGGEAQALMVVATAAAIAIGEGKSVEDLSVLAALLSVIGDQLALLATVRSTCEDEEPAGIPPIPNV